MPVTPPRLVRPETPQKAFRWRDVNSVRGRPLVMGVINVTPDSFSDGGVNLSVDDARRSAVAMTEAGADMLDVGGESTRPGSDGMGIEQELERVIPVLEAIRFETDLPISIDTSKPVVMREAFARGADAVNDVCALRVEGALEVVRDLAAPVCLMHMRGEPRTMQDAPYYDDVVEDVRAFLVHRARACEANGLARDCIAIDPGFGFGKTADHNLQLVNRLCRLTDTGYPVMVGVSRKSTIGKLTGRAPGQRIIGSVAMAVVAAMRGAEIVRVHDVAETVDALAVLEGVINERVKHG